MVKVFTPTDWHWIVGNDAERAWSSAAGGYVNAVPADATRIASEAELTEVLRTFGLRGPAPSATDVRAEASRRMQALVGARDAAHLEIIISNGNREAIRLQNKKLKYLAGEGADWTSAETLRAAQLSAFDAAIEAIRSASNVLESSPPVDYFDDSHWPAAS